MSRASLIKNFTNLYAKAAVANKIVAKHTFDPSKYPTDEALKKALVSFGQTLAHDFAKAGVKPEDIEDEVADLMKMLAEIKVEPDFLDCKAPLAIDDIKFKDIAGLQDVKLQLDVNYIKPFVYPRLFPAIAKGILFYGVPGGGKTMLAKAATAEIGEAAAFFAPTPGELRGKFEGDTEKNIDAVFRCAENLINDPNAGYKFAIIFFDEFESIAGLRGDDPGMTRSVNALLQAMDGIKQRPNISVLAATNFPDKLDFAILRRFTTRIFIDLPDDDAREYLIRDTLAQAYGSPNMSAKEKRDSIRTTDKGTFIQDTAYMLNIAKYGGFEGKASGWWVTKPGDKYITNTFVATLVDRFGPTSDGAKIISEVKSGKIVDKTDSRLETRTAIFGYSPSDITKIMEMAVKFASTRALQGNATKTNVREWGGAYYIVKPNGDTEVAKLTGAEAALVINFDIRESDVEHALKALSSTVDNEGYLELLSYSRKA